MISTKNNIALILIISAALLSACSSIHNRETEYTRATSISELKIPQNISTQTLDNHYPIPPLKGDAPVTPADLTPPGLTAAENKAEQDTNAKQTKR